MTFRRTYQGSLGRGNIVFAKAREGEGGRRAKRESLSSQAGRGSAERLQDIWQRRAVAEMA